MVDIPARLLVSLVRSNAGERERQAWAALSDLVRGSVGLAQQPDAASLTQAAGSGAREMAALEEEPTRMERATTSRPSCPVAPVTAIDMSHSWYVGLGGLERPASSTQKQLPIGK